ncbi:MAG: pentapeptide repeat-containing protein, partial [Phormidium sp.]
MLSNLTRKNLQGISFKGRDLTGVDFSHADIRGADFTNANLTNADFSYALAGLPKKWEIGVLLVAAILSGISGAATVMAVYRTVSFLIIKPDAPLGIIPALLSFLFILSINIFLLLITQKEGLQKTFGILASAVAICLPLLGILSSISNDNNRFLNLFRSFRMGNFVEVLRGGNASEAAYIIVPLVMAVAATITVIITLNLAVVLAAFVGANKEVQLIKLEALAIGVFITGLVTRNGARYLQNLTAEIGVIILAIMLAVALILVSLNIAKEILKEDDKYGVLRQIAIAISTLGGTSFRNANLTNANFSYATLKSTDLRNANTTRTLWHKSFHLNQARVGNTILINPRVRDLLVTGNGHQRNFVNANLRGANLIRADLSYANLKAANISEATFQDACLEWVNLTQTQAISADFTNSQMTGVCGLATWNIDSTTQLEWVDCRWIYLLEYPKMGTD